MSEEYTKKKLLKSPEFGRSIVAAILSQRGELDCKTFDSNGGQRYSRDKFSWVRPMVATVANDEECLSLRDQKQLKGVVIRFDSMKAPMTDSGLGHLSRLTDLLCLNFIRTHDRDSSHQPYQITDIGLKCLSDFCDLEYLSLSQTKVLGVGFKHLSKLQKLRTLDLYGSEVDDGGLKFLSSLHALEELDLDETKVRGSGFSYLSSLQNLRRIGFPKQLGDDGLEHFAAFKHMESVNLCYSQVTDVGIASLSGLREMVKLNLSGTQITDIGLKSLSNLTNLKELSLSGTQITDSGLKSLSNLMNLKELSLSGTQITDSGLKHLSNMTELERLDLCECTEITYKGLSFLPAMPLLQYLNLGGTWVSRSDITKHSHKWPYAKVLMEDEHLHPHHRQNKWPLKT